MGPQAKPFTWMGDSLDVLRGFPETVRSEIGYALYLAQTGGKHSDAKPLHGLGPGVIEMPVRHPSGAYRAVYWVHVQDAVYVLHSFQKKSHKGAATPRAEIDQIRRRLKRAMDLHSSGST